jgi:hypothetical protein
VVRGEVFGDAVGETVGDTVGGTVIMLGLALVPTESTIPAARNRKVADKTIVLFSIKPPC